MSKVAHYLQEHLMGEVMISPDARRFFATDASILTLTPTLIVYPRNENDVRKVARFTWQLAERGRVIPITARGAGTDLAGAALGSGIVLAFPAHMHRILELDNKSGLVVVEPGINYAKLQQTLHTHDRFLPPYPASVEYSTIGGAVANNSSGEKSVKYGDTRDYVRSLRVVLANGEIIETGRLNKRELGKKLGLSTFEGEIYRAIDALLEEKQELIEKTATTGITKNSAGYFLSDIKRKDGSFDLTPLIVGSQGTLGLVTEITLETEAYNPTTALIAAQFDELEKAQSAVLELRDLSDMPSAIEMVDDQLLMVVDKLNPNQLKDVISKPFPRVVMLIEFDSQNERIQKKMLKKTQKILEKLGASYQVEHDPLEQEKLWKIRHASAAVVAHAEGNLKALPFIEDGIVPPERFREYLEGLYGIFARAHLQAAVWGHAGDAHLHVQPFLDLSQVGDRQKAFRLMEECSNLVISLGGSIAGEHGEGRLRAPYMQKQYGPELYAVFQKVKQIFDPYGTLNPGVKVNVNLDSVKALLRSGYSLDHLYNHMPRS
ncbi:MAG TPA: FAD-linked oxidase C-terminal domain-containing protein [Candidatus Saccharimonadales bacterium]|nr:FAD-linked oxidase C-terminal domain-containing protein [Candidatus Saccharimonadales bacterium]